MKLSNFFNFLIKMQKNFDQFSQALDQKLCLSYENLQFLSESPDFLRCSLCSGFILNPVLCKCPESHLFGRKCLLDHLRTKSECPVSHQPLTTKQISSVSFELLEKMSAIKLKCEFCKEFQGNSGNLKYHLKECGFIEIPCPFYGKFCMEKVKKKDLKLHIKSGLQRHLEAAKTAFQIEKLQVLFEVLQETLK
jgi:hypothetical protein